MGEGAVRGDRRCGDSALKAIFKTGCRYPNNPMNSDLLVENGMIVNGEPDQPELPFDDLGRPVRDLWHSPPDAAGGVCESCITHNITLDNALKYGAERKEAIEINGLFQMGLR